MGLLNNSSKTTPRLHSMDLTQSSAGITVPVAYGTIRGTSYLLDYFNFWSKGVSEGGKGGKDYSSYDYYASIVALLCEGPVVASNNVWGTDGKLTANSVTETVTLSSTTYTVSNSSTYAVDQGVSYAASYSVTADDYGSGGSTTLSGTQNVVMSSTTGTVSSGQYSVSNGVYTFNSSDVGKTVQISYSYSLYYLQTTEDNMVPAGGGTITVQKQTQYVSNVSVIYTTTDKTMTAVSGTPTVAGTYNPNGGNYLFASADQNQAIAITYKWKNNNSDVSTSSVFEYTLIDGYLEQSPWTYLTSAYYSRALGYSGMALVCSENMALGAGATTPNYNYEISGKFIVGGGILDADPVSCIEDVLTNEVYGAGYDGTIDSSLESLTKPYWYANNFFISDLINSQTTAADVIQKWCDAGNVGVFSSEGKIKFIPYGDTTAVGNGYTYTPQTSPVVDLDDYDFLQDGDNDPIQISRTAWQDAYNKVKVEYTNRANDYKTGVVTEEDAYSVNTFGLRQEGQRSYQFLTNPTSATFSANIALKRNVYIRRKFKFKLSALRYGWLDPMDIVTLTDSALGLSLYPVRILSLSESSDFSLDIEAEEFCWGTTTATINPKQAVNPYQPAGSSTDPGNTTAYIFETNTVESTNSANVIKAAVTGGADWGGCDIYTSYNGDYYTKAGTITSGHKAGVTTTLLPLGADPDTTNTLTVDMSTSGATLTSVTQSDADAYTTLCGILNSDGTVELISYETATLNSDGTYTLSYLRRGVYSSTVSSHAIGSKFVRIDYSLFEAEYPASYAGSTIYFKFPAFNLFNTNMQSLANVAAVAFTIPGTTLQNPTGTFSISPSNPLTAYYNGTSGIVSCATFTESIGSLSHSCSPANTLTGLTPGQTYYIYYIDKSFSGGSITIYATQYTSTFYGVVGYYQIGTVTIPTGSAETLHPTLYSTGGGASVTSPTNAFDGNQTTCAVLQVGAVSGTSGISAVTSSLALYGFNSASETVNTATLSVVRSVDIYGTPTTPYTIRYSLDGGTTISTLESSYTAAAKGTITLSLSSSQDFTKVRLYMASSAVADSSGVTGALIPSIYEAYITIY